MKTTIEYDATKTLTELLKRVAQGERITITKNGMPVATIEPPVVNEKPADVKGIAALKETSHGNTLGAELVI